MKNRKRSSAQESTWIHEHPVMTFFLGIFALSTVVAVAQAASSPRIA